MIDLGSFCRSRGRLPVSKRLFDIVAASVGLVVLSPFGALGAAVVALCDGRPVLYLAHRVGCGGRQIVVPKLRSMRIGGSPQRITSGVDPRLFRGASVLRKFKIDELPQLLSVLRGDMTVVGPRPEDPVIVRDHYWNSARWTLEMPPGLTSPGTLAYMREYEFQIGSDAEREYVESVLPKKIALDLDYMCNWRLRDDLGVIVETLLTLASRTSGQP